MRSITAVHRLGIFICAAIAVLAALAAGVGGGEVRATQALHNPTVTPAAVYAGIATRVRVCIRAAYDPALVASSVNLLRVRADGGKSVVSRMYDDGTHGDILANDGTFTALLDLEEPSPTVLGFQVSAGYRGQARRVLSEVFSLEVRAVPNLEETWNRFVTCLVNRDLDGAMEYIRLNRREEYRNIFERIGSEKLSMMFSTARDFRRREIGLFRAAYTFTAVNRGVEAQGEVIFIQDIKWDDVWRIDFIGF
ncbi:MAG: hypothetical protein A4E67_02162 [Syntrophaceae bacterium PtaB.Bin038]|nr:MAG: hypothetical protein A4E67_02162 [Syntrophaceae bacterium PtaB.Bin038]